MEINTDTLYQLSARCIYEQQRSLFGIEKQKNVYIL